MNFTNKSISYQQTGFFSRIITDYLSGNGFLRNFYSHPVSTEGIESAIQDREKFPTDRQLLVNILKKQYDGMTLPHAVQKNLHDLASENTFTVTTAHQPAIFTGNLYFIYKILHVVKIASNLKIKFPERNFVPVFYMGCEDADLEELGHIYLDGEKLNWDTHQTGAVGRMKTEGLEKIVERIEGEFSGEPFGPELIQMLKDCYLGSESIQQATFNLLHLLFGSYGLIVLIPDNRILKSVLRGVFRDDLTSHIPFQVTEENVNKLSNHYPVQANPREINLFYLRDNMRERIDWKDGRFFVHNTNIHFSPEAMESELANFPERFSPNVILRGLYQCTILPDIIFVGGGGETAYWLEFKPLFQHYRVPFPVLVLRNSFLVIRNNHKLKMEKIGLSSEAIFRPAEELMEEYIRTHSDRQLSLEKQLQEMRVFYGTVKDISGEVDKTLEQHVERLEAQAMQKLEELEKKIVRAEKKNHEEVRRRIYDVREALFPQNNLQERIDNFIPWYAIYGKKYFDVLLMHSPALEQVFTLLEEVEN
jgi:bacillithiol biosynthesis cysteine-adding enzyme BshC